MFIYIFEKYKTSSSTKIHTSRRCILLRLILTYMDLWIKNFKTIQNKPFIHIQYNPYSLAHTLLTHRD